MNIKKLKVGMVITLMMMLTSMALSYVSSEYEEMAWEHYDEYMEAEVGEDEIFFEQYVDDFESSETVLQIAGLLIWIVLIAMVILTYLVCKSKEIK